ncbi:proprotein convertase P-domain-containing protein, partial [Haloechinothrix salitolerans]
AYFDIYPSGNAAEFNGAWSVYPYFDSGTVIISGIEQGLVVVKPDLTGGASTEFSSTESVRIKAGSTVTSAVEVSGIDGSAPTNLEVAPEITHRTPSALVIDLIAPDGGVYPLKADGEAPQPSYTVDASASPASGTWQLRITDTRNGGKPGELTSWSLRF